MKAAAHGPRTCTRPISIGMAIAGTARAAGSEEEERCAGLCWVGVVATSCWALCAAVSRSVIVAMVCE